MKAKYMVTSGFLGAGKTTSMIAFSRSIDRRGLGRAAILVDDLGARNIVDAEQTAASQVMSQSISGDCICYQHENLVDKLHQLIARGADVIFSDIPGCGIGALDNVYLQLERREPGEFQLLPFLCIADPERIPMIMPEQAELGLPREMRFLLDAQLAEADLIVLNKIDTISREQQQRITDFLRQNYPTAQVMAMSALTGEGVDEVVDLFLGQTAPAVHKEIGYGSEAFVAAEKLMSWYNRRVFLEQRQGRDLDFNAVIADLFEAIRAGVKRQGGNVPHLKMFASDSPDNSGDYFKASLLGVDHDIDFTHRLARPYTALSLVINARAVVPSQEMAAIVDEALDAAAEKYGLKVKTFFMEAFGMMEEGKGNLGRASKY